MIEDAKIFSAGVKKLVKFDEIKSQKELCTTTGIPASTMSGWFTSRSPIPEDKQETISEALGVPIVDIIEHGKIVLGLTLKTRRDEEFKHLMENLQHLMEKLQWKQDMINDLKSVLEMKNERIAELERIIGQFGAKKNTAI